MSKMLEAPAVADALLDHAHREGLPVRLIGSLAVRAYSARERPFPYGDIDLAALSCNRAQLQRFMAARDWRINERYLLLSERREVYTHRDARMTVDVFYDAVEGNHTIDFASRLTLAYPALQWTDVLLTKVQRRELRDADIWDLCALTDSALDGIDRGRFATVLGSDWGLYQDVQANLTRLEAHCADFAWRTLGRIMAGAPRSVAWHLRAIVGYRVKWWSDVVEVAGVR